MDATQSQAKTLYREIAARLEAEEEGVVQGKMMSSPGIKYGNKVFAFYHSREDMMVFKLGKEFDPEAAGIEEYSFLNPFKNKPPMKGWFQIPYSQHDRWEELARRALRQMKSELD